MAIGRNSWKGAKEKAKNKSNNLDRQKKLHPYLYKDETKDNKRYSYTATSHRIPVKEVNEITPNSIIKMNKTKGMPLNSPMEGNAFGKAMADAGGDYEKAKAMLDNDVATMKAEYGTGAPTKMHLGVPHPESTRDRVKDRYQIRSEEKHQEKVDRDRKDQLTQQQERLRERVKKDQLKQGKKLR